MDVETSGLDFKRNHIVGYVVTFSPKPPDSYYIPVRHLGNANLGGRDGPTTPFNWDKKLAPGEADLLRALDEPGTVWFGHNFGFDLKFMLKTARCEPNLNFELRPRAEDTQINEPILDEYAGKFSLEACALRRKVQAKKGDLIKAYLISKFPEIAKDPKNAMGHYWRLAGNDPMAVEYAEGDGTTTWQLRDVQMLDILREEEFDGHPVPTLETVWDVESRLIPVLARMSFKGIRIDEEYLSKLQAYIKKTLEVAEREFPKGFNFRSPADVREWMTQQGCTDWPMTPASKRFPKGQPSMAKGWLENSEPGKKIVQVRKMETLRDTFVHPLHSSHMFNGRVHTNYNQLRNDEFGVVVGRLSSNDPNLQAVPKHDEEIGYIYRQCFVPDLDKPIWGSPDYNQCEPRLLAYYSRSPVLVNGYLANPPLDAHTAVAIAANKNWADMDDKARKHYRNEYAKRINQTIITGGGKNVLVAKYKVDPNEVNRVWNDYFRAMPQVKTIQKQMTAMPERRGYILTLLNRRCRTPPDGRTYVALNRALQGGNADIIKLKMCEVDDYLASVGRPIDMLNNCHDAVDFQFSEDTREYYEKSLEIMQDFESPGSLISLQMTFQGKPTRIPITVDGGEGRNWAIATYGEKQEKKPERLIDEANRGAPNLGPRKKRK